MFKKFLPFAALLALTVLLLYFRLPSWFAHGNEQVIEAWGDGYKSYHSVLWHTQYDTSYTHFNGMNYPYGEHVVPGDCQPVLSNTMKALKDAGWDLTPYGLGIFHGFLLLGIVLSVVFLYAIFTRLRLPWWYAALLAVLLTALAPQFARLSSHFGLGHMEAIPMVLYVLLRWHEQPRWAWSLVLASIVGFFSLIHFYFFAILGFTIVGIVATRWLVRKDWRQTPAYLGHGLIMLGLPFLFFFFWMMYNDPVTDRNPAPWGFFAYSSHITGIVFSPDVPFTLWLNNRIGPLELRDFESRAFIGMTAVVFCLGILVMLLRWTFLKWPLSVRNPQEQFLHYALASGAVILVFAQGFPFTVPGWEDWLHYAGPLRQFRSIGRFGWIFFYAANLSAFYYLYQWSLPKTGRAWWKNAATIFVVIVAFSFLGYEAWHYNKARDLRLDTVENFEKGHQFTDRGIDYSRYQAILPIPYYNIGSDNFWWAPSGLISQKAQTMSLQTGLPLMSAMLTRTSLSQTIAQLQLVTEPYRMPRLLMDLPSVKPLIMIWDEARVREFTGEKSIHLKEGLDTLYHSDYLYIFALPLNAFSANLQRQQSRVEASMDTLVAQPGQDWRLPAGYDGGFLYKSYDELPAQERPYFGQGHFEGAVGQQHILLDTVWESPYTGDLTISLWMHLNQDRAAATFFTWEEYDAQTGELLNRWVSDAHRVTWLFDDVGWGLLEWNLPRNKAGSKLVLSCRNDALLKGTIQMDELLIRPKDVPIGRQLPAYIWWNNRAYPRN